MRDSELCGVEIPAGIGDAHLSRRREPRSRALGRPRRLRHPPPAEADARVRRGTAHLPRHACRARGDDHRDQRPPRSPSEPSPRPRRRPAPDHRYVRARARPRFRSCSDERAAAEPRRACARARAARGRRTPRSGTWRSTGPSNACTWTELDTRSDQVAGALAERGLGTGDRLGLGLRNSIEFVMSALAAWKLGATPVPIRWDLPEWEFSRLRDVVDAKVFLGARRHGMDRRDGRAAGSRSHRCDRTERRRHLQQRVDRYAEDHRQSSPGRVPRRARHADDAELAPGGSGRRRSSCSRRCTTRTVSRRCTRSSAATRS